MVKKTNSKRRGIRRGVQRHKIRAGRVKADGSTLLKLLHATGIDGHQVAQAADLCVGAVNKVCTRLCFIPLETLSKGQYKDVPLWKRRIHWFLASHFIIFVIYKFGITMYVVVCEDLSAVTFMSACSTVALALGVTASSGTSVSTAEAKDLLNIFGTFSRTIHDSDERKLKVLDSVPLCLKLIAITFLTLCAALNAAAFCLVYDDLLVCVFPILKKLGFIPETSLPVILWQIAFYPVEVLTLLPPMLNTAFNGHILVTGLGMLRMHADELRLVNTTPFLEPLLQLSCFTSTWYLFIATGRLI